MRAARRHLSLLATLCLLGASAAFGQSANVGGEGYFRDDPSARPVVNDRLSRLRAQRELVFREVWTIGGSRSIQESKLTVRYRISEIRRKRDILAGVLNRAGQTNEDVRRAQRTIRDANSIDLGALAGFGGRQARDFATQSAIKRFVSRVGAKVFGFINIGTTGGEVASAAGRKWYSYITVSAIENDLRQQRINIQMLIEIYLALGGELSLEFSNDQRLDELTTEAIALAQAIVDEQSRPTGPAIRHAIQAREHDHSGDEAERRRFNEAE